MKYVLLGALAIGFNAPAMAQADNKAIIENITKVIKSNPADLNDQVKAVYKKNKKNALLILKKFKKKLKKK